MTEQSIISDADLPAASLETVLAGVGEDQILCCSFDPERGMWDCKTHAASGHDITSFGVGTTLAAAIADLHTPIWMMKTVRDADFGLREWSTEDEPS